MALFDNEPEGFLFALSWHDVTCPEGPECRSRSRHAASDNMWTSGILARYEKRSLELAGERVKAKLHEQFPADQIEQWAWGKDHEHPSGEVVFTENAPRFVDPGERGMLCHCGARSMRWHNTGSEFPDGLRDYCRACATSRCDTSAGMEEGCPNARASLSDPGGP